MSIQEQIDAAWKGRFGENITNPPGAEWIYHEGYLAALRSLFVEVKPEDLGNKYHDHIWVRLKDGVWHESSGINGGFVYLLRAETDGYIYRSWTEKRPADEVDLVVGLADLPSPSDLFMEGRA